jgi:hypothetical protein
VLYLRLIIFSVGDDVSIDNEIFLVTDFVNLKIKSIQSFKYVYSDSMCVHVFIGVSDRTYMNYRTVCFFIKKVRSYTVRTHTCSVSTYRTIPFR